MPEPVLKVHTIKYKQYLKETIVEALRAVFASHPDPILKKTKVDIEFGLEEVDYPAVIVRFYERSIRSAGVAHIEFGELLDTGGLPTGRYVKYRHSFYTGDLELAIYALSSYDRDLISDSLVQILQMADTEAYTDAFLSRVYRPDPTQEPTSLDHMINFNLDDIQGMGESQQPAPWQPEDVLLFQNSYRFGVFGQFYSRTPVAQDYGLVEFVDSFPYQPDAGEPIPEPPDPGPDRTYGTGDDVPSSVPWEG